MRFLWMSALCLGAWTAPVRATTVQHVALDQMTAMADVVVLGTVTDARSHLLANGLTATTYRLQVDEFLKGRNRRGAALRFTVPGGRIGNRELLIPGMPRIRVGQRSMFFLNRPGALGTCVPIGLGQGKFDVVRDPKTGRDHVRRNLGGLEIIDPKTRRVVKRSALRSPLTLDRLVADVRALVARGR